MPPADLFRLPLTIERKSVAHMARSGRTTTIIHLESAGEHGYGEEVTFQAGDLLRESPRESWEFSRTFGEFSEWLESVDLFDRPPEYEVVRHYRRWAFEAAALDLALRQAGLGFHEAVGRKPEPVHFVVSGHAPEGARLKIDAVDLRPGLPVDVIDFKLQGDRAAVESALELYPGALLEDPPVVVPGARVSWDIPITSADEVRRLAEKPASINVKPARLGSLAELFATYELCATEGIEVYGGGQHELGPGRGQIQLLASLFHARAPNDVAPAGYNEPRPVDGLPRSPLAIAPRVGFGTD